MHIVSTFRIYQMSIFPGLIPQNICRGESFHESLLLGIMLKDEDLWSSFYARLLLPSLDARARAVRDAE